MYEPTLIGNTAGASNLPSSQKGFRELNQDLYEISQRLYTIVNRLDGVHSTIGGKFQYPLNDMPTVSDEIQPTPTFESNLQTINHRLTQLESIIASIE